MAIAPPGILGGLPSRWIRRPSLLHVAAKNNSGPLYTDSHDGASHSIDPSRRRPIDGPLLILDCGPFVEFNRFGSALRWAIRGTSTTYTSC